MYTLYFMLSGLSIVVQLDLSKVTVMMDLHIAYTILTPHHVIFLANFLVLCHTSHADGFNLVHMWI